MDAILRRQRGRALCAPGRILAVILPLVLPFAAGAEETLPPGGTALDGPALRGACSAERACVAWAGGFVEALRRQGAPLPELNERLGILAALLIAEAHSGTAARSAVAAALRLLAEASTDAAQAHSMRTLAAILADPAVALDGLELFTPVAASPS
ncbi:amino acid synthesis family protein [Meinhardsimonia xiamenensis]|jgi:hypothetical protein|uniref:amino acid synthesis family protein n=1 Tax=Meinhardsimonia xiamenensis TaxID=990712 RepID=UPI00115FA853|nr:amino acid synthesis family protein [Meinhardsimonia xiamenensis]